MYIQTHICPYANKHTHTQEFQSLSENYHSLTSQIYSQLQAQASSRTAQLLQEASAITAWAAQAERSILTLTKRNGGKTNGTTQTTASMEVCTVHWQYQLIRFTVFTIQTFVVRTAFRIWFKGGKNSCLGIQGGAKLQWCVYGTPQSKDLKGKRRVCKGG